MLLTLFLLGLVYAVLIGVLFAAGAGAVTIAVIAAVLFLIQFFTSCWTKASLRCTDALTDVAGGKRGKHRAAFAGHGSSADRALTATDRSRSR